MRHLKGMSLRQRWSSRHVGEHLRKPWQVSATGTSLSPQQWRQQVIAVLLPQCDQEPSELLLLLLQPEQPQVKGGADSWASGSSTRCSFRLAPCTAFPSCPAGANSGVRCCHSRLSLWNNPAFCLFAFSLLNIIKTNVLCFPAALWQVWTSRYGCPTARPELGPPCPGLQQPGAVSLRQRWRAALACAISLSPQRAPGAEALTMCTLRESGHGASSTRVKRTVRTSLLLTALLLAFSSFLVLFIPCGERKLNAPFYP